MILLCNCSQLNLIREKMFGKLFLLSTKITHAEESFGSGVTAVY